MFSFVDLRLALLLGAAVLLVRAQGEDDRKFHHCLLELLNSFFFLFSTNVEKKWIFSPWVDSC